MSLNTRTVLNNNSSSFSSVIVNVDVDNCDFPPPYGWNADSNSVANSHPPPTYSSVVLNSSELNSDRARENGQRTQSLNSDCPGSEALHSISGSICSIDNQYQKSIDSEVPNLRDICLDGISNGPLRLLHQAFKGFILAVIIVGIIWILKSRVLLGGYYYIGIALVLFLIFLFIGVLVQ